MTSAQETQGSDLSTPYTLITYFRSSCSARLRIALSLESLAFKPVYIDLLNGEQHSQANLACNPSHSVPTLILNTSSRPSPKDFHITQSLAALEYLEELHPSPALLPSDAGKRAIVRTLANIIACDTQPVTNLRILERVGTLKAGTAEEKVAARAQWAKELMTDGLAAFESMVKQFAGRYSVGDEVSMADVCLVPACWGAKRFGVEMSLSPTVARIHENMASLECVKRAHWKAQGDTPENLRS